MTAHLNYLLLLHFSTQFHDMQHGTIIGVGHIKIESHMNIIESQPDQKFGTL